jgi:hypothetical protein
MQREQQRQLERYQRPSCATAAREQRGLTAWTTLFGTVSFDLFDQLLHQFGGLQS